MIDINSNQNKDEKLNEEKRIMHTCIIRNYISNLKLSICNISYNENGFYLKFDIIHFAQIQKLSKKVLSKICPIEEMIIWFYLFFFKQSAININMIHSIYQVNICIVYITLKLFVKNLPI